MWDKYGKSIIAFLFTVYSVVQPLWFGDHHIDPDEGIIIALAIVNNLLVYLIPLSPGFKGAKTIIMALLAALVAAQSAIADGWKPEDWPIVIGAFVAALGVFLAPAISTSGPVPVEVGTGSDA